MATDIENPCGQRTARESIGRTTGLIAGFIAALVLGGCAALTRDRELFYDESGYAGAAPSMPETGSVLSETGCRLKFLLYRGTGRRTDVLAVAAPGFLRDQAHLADLAHTLAAHGISAVTFNPCNTRPWDGRHYRTGLDMRRIARTLGAERVLYLGVSAGGLSALAAARADRTSVGAVTLDLVDSQDLGRLLAPGLDRPLVGLAGEPGLCNGQGNGLAVYRLAPQGRAIRVPGATHCDFESPTDRLCEMLCGRRDAGTEARREAIRAATVAAVEAMLAHLQSGHRRKGASH